ncbi:MAG: hypothetical protein ACJ71P_14520 [Nitrososphaeraceae archaeon]
MINKKMDFISSMAGLVYCAIGIAISCVGLSIYLILSKDKTNIQKRTAQKWSKQMHDES